MSDTYLEEFILARLRVPCPDCDLREDLRSYPDTKQGKPLKVKPEAYSRVRRCGTCKGHGWVVRGHAS